MRERVRWATQPFSNSSRAWATSSCRPNTPGPWRTRANVGPDQVQHQVDVVNHQVEHGADVGRTGGEQPARRGVDESRGGQIGLRRPTTAGLKRSTWPDLQHGTAAAAGGHQFVGFADTGGQRLFDQHVQAAIEKVECHVAMSVRRGGDDRGVDFVDQVAIVGHGGGAACAAASFARLSASASATPTEAHRRARPAAGHGSCPSVPRPRLPIAACSRGSPAFAGPAVLAFLLLFDEGQQLVDFGAELVVAAENFAGVVQTDLGPIQQSVGFGQAMDDVG